MTLYAFALYEPIAGALAARLQAPPGRFSLGRFANGEMHVTLGTSPTGHDCLVLGAVAPPDEHLLAALLLSHTLKKDGARRVTALLPYLGYACHNKQQPGESLGAAWVSDMVRASGIDEVVTVDVHSSRVHQLFLCRCVHSRRRDLPRGTDATCDDRDDDHRSGRGRDRAVRGRKAGCRYQPRDRLLQEEANGRATHSTMHGQVGPRAIVIDDILDTGGTLLSCCEALARAGVREITVMVTHGLFTVLSVIPLLCDSLESRAHPPGRLPPTP